MSGGQAEGFLELRFCAGAVAEPATIADVLDEDCHLPVSGDLAMSRASCPGDDDSRIAGRLRRGRRAVSSLFYRRLPLVSRASPWLTPNQQAQMPAASG